MEDDFNAPRNEGRHAEPAAPDILAAISALHLRLDAMEARIGSVAAPDSSLTPRSAAPLKPVTLADAIMYGEEPAPGRYEPPVETRGDYVQQGRFGSEDGHPQTTVGTQLGDEHFSPATAIDAQSLKSREGLAGAGAKAPGLEVSHEAPTLGNFDPTGHVEPTGVSVDESTGALAARPKSALYVPTEDGAPTMSAAEVDALFASADALAMQRPDAATILDPAISEIEALSVSGNMEVPLGAEGTVDDHIPTSNPLHPDAGMIEVNAELADRVPMALAVAALAVPIEILPGKMVCVVAEPRDFEALARLGKSVGLLIETKEAPMMLVVGALRELYKPNQAVRVASACSEVSEKPWQSVCRLVRGFRRSA